PGVVAEGAPPGVCLPRPAGDHQGRPACPGPTAQAIARTDPQAETWPAQNARSGPTAAAEAAAAACGGAVPAPPPGGHAPSEHGREEPAEAPVAGPAAVAPLACQHGRGIPLVRSPRQECDRLEASGEAAAAGAA